VVSTEEGQEFARENGLVFVEASAKSAEKVEEAFLRTAELVYQRQFSQDPDEVGGGLGVVWCGVVWCQSTLMTTLMDFFFSFLSFYYSLPSTIRPHH
jgi:hypothetical protein